MNELLLLGPVSLKNQNNPFTIRRRQVRALFYRLGVRLKKVPRENLCDMFWPDLEDASARRNLSHIISHLRHSLPDPELLITTKDYLQLNRSVVQIDTERFLNLTNSSLNRTTIPELTHAIDLYRGPLISGFSLSGSSRFEEWLFFERQDFELRYLRTLKLLIEKYEARKDYQKAIDYAKQFLSVNELSEDIHQQIMILYAASGDRQSALHQFEVCAKVFERELGIKPLNETRTIYQSILKDLRPKSNINHQSPVLFDLPDREIPLVGRKDILSRFSEILKLVKSGQGRVLLLSGESGIGKTRLIQDFTSIAKKDTLIFSAACQLQDKSLPYQPIVQVLRSEISIGKIEKLVPSIWIDELAQLLPELRRSQHEELSWQSLEPGEARLRLYEALVQTFLSLAKLSGPLIFCIDDLHNADSSTKDWLLYLSKRIFQSHLLIIGGYRTEDSEAIIDLKIALNRAGILSEIKLCGLDSDSTKKIVTHFIPKDPMAENFSERLQQSTNGNPFLIIETLRALKEGGKFEQDFASIETLPLPDSICQAAQERIRRIDPIPRQILEAAAVFGEPFNFDLIHLLSGRSEIETSDGLAALITRQFIIYNTELNEYSFQHDLIRRAVKENLNPIRRQLLHQRAGWALEQLSSNFVESLAYHYDLGGENQKAIYYHELAVKRAEKLFAWGEVEVHQERLLAILERTKQFNSENEIALKQAKILIGRAHKNHLIGNLAGRDRALESLKALSLKSKNPDIAIQSSLHNTTFLNLDAQYQKAILEAKNGIKIAQKVGDTISKTLLMNQIGFSNYFLGDPEKALSYLEPALSELDEGDIATRRHLTHTIGYVFFHLGDFQKALRMQKETYENHRIMGDKIGMVWAGLDIGATFLKMGRKNEAKHHLSTNLDLARRIGTRSAEAYGLTWSGYWEMFQGNYYDALQLFHQSLSLELGLHSTHGRVSAEEGIGLAYYHLRDPDQARHWLELAVNHARPIGHIRRFIIALTGLGLVEILDKHLESALIYLQEAVEASLKSMCKEGLSRGLAVLARAYRMRGDTGTALEHANNAIQIAMESNLPACEIFGKIEAALAFLDQGDSKTAFEHTESALASMTFSGECWLASEEVLYAHYTILNDLGYLKTANDYLRQTVDIIKAKAEGIPDSGLREKYLQFHNLV